MKKLVQLKDKNGNSLYPDNEYLKNIINEATTYKDGDIYQITNQFYTGGCITGSSKTIMFSLITPKSLKDIKNITVKSINIAVRSVGGGYIVNEVVDVSLITPLKSADNIVSFSINYENALNAVNNTPVNVYVRTAEIIFNK